MGQILTQFFPNREKPDISPITTREKPLNGSRDSFKSTMEIAVTRAEFISAAPGPAIST